MKRAIYILWVYLITNQIIKQKYSIALNPTLNFSSGVIGKIPVLQTNDNEKNKKINTLVSENIAISLTEWDCFEKFLGFQINIHF